jgi:hypothetical protein
MPPSYSMKMEGVSFSETLQYIYHSTWRHFTQPLTLTHVMMLIRMFLHTLVRTGLFPCKFLPFAPEKLFAFRPEVP